MVNGKFHIICGMTLLLALRVDGIPSFIKGYKMIRHRNPTVFHSCAWNHPVERERNRFGCRLWCRFCRQGFRLSRNHLISERPTEAFG